MEKKPLRELEVSHHLSVHITAPAKYGKTTCGISAPRPILWGDVDKGLESLLKTDVVPSEMLDGIDITEIESYAQAQELFQSGWKDGPGGKPYKTVILDTFSTLLNRVIKKKEILKGREKMELQDWGLYLERGLHIALTAHELAIKEDGCHTILMFHEADKGGEDGEIGKLGPAVSGQLFNILPGIPNFSFFLRIRRLGLNANKTPKLVRQLQTGADNRTPAGSRSSLDMYEAPDISAIWEKVKKKDAK